MSLSFPTILVISDDESKIAFLKNALKKAFFILSVPDGASALESISDMLVDLIIMDEMIADQSPLHLVEKIRKAEGYFSIPILLITHSLKKGFILDALSKGINDFLQTPLNEEEIYQRIAVAIHSKPIDHKTALVVEKIRKADTKMLHDKTLRDKLILNDIAIKEIAKAKKSGEMLSLLYLRAFKQSNESLPFLKKRLRITDILIPQGEGSYLIILPSTSPQAAKEIAEDIHHEHPELTVTPIGYEKIPLFDFKQFFP